jgi:hypothetical protein
MRSLTGATSLEASAIFWSDSQSWSIMWILTGVQHKHWECDMNGRDMPRFTTESLIALAILLASLPHRALPDRSPCRACL